MIRFFKHDPNVLAVMSGKRDGNMKINHDGEKSTNANRKKYFSKKGISEKHVISALLHHSSKVVAVKNLKSLFIPKTDARISYSSEEVFSGENGYFEIRYTENFPLNIIVSSNELLDKYIEVKNNINLIHIIMNNK